MANSYALTGNDQISIGRSIVGVSATASLAFGIGGTIGFKLNKVGQLSDFADGDIGHLTFPNEINAFEIGKDGNAILAFDERGTKAELMLRILRGSNDDRRLLSYLQQYMALKQAFVLLEAQVTKNVGNGKGIVHQVSYDLTGVHPTGFPEVVVNVAGGIEQAVSVWKFRGVASLHVG